MAFQVIGTYIVALLVANQPSHDPWKCKNRTLLAKETTAKQD